MRPFAFLAGAGFLALAACSPAAETPEPTAEPVAEAVEAPYGPGPDHVEGEAADAVVNGTATWEGGALPETAKLIIEVRDLTRPPEGGDLLLKEEFLVAAGSPAAFLGTVSKFDLIPGGNLVLRARIQDGYAILLASDGDIDIADSGETAGLEVPLFNPEDLARGRPAQMITPAGTAYVCGGEPVTIAVEAGAAYVTFGDGTSVKLDKLETAAGANTQFTNGRFVVEQSGEALRFGRGRATPMVCTAG
jgi:Type III secretion system lipoprotein chaperone (YscW)